MTNGKGGPSISNDDSAVGRADAKSASPSSREDLAAAPASNDTDLQAALAQSDIQADNLLTHYNHGQGRIVLVPKTGERILVELRGWSEKEAGP